MDLGLAGKTAFVTGSSSGIGAAVARIFAEEGADVVVSYHQDQAGAEQTVADVQALGRRAWLCQMDMTDPQSIAKAVEQLRFDVNGLDCVALCAGLNIITPVDKITPEEWNQVMAVNLYGPFFVIQALLPYLCDPAAVVTVASVAAHTGNANHAHYAAAKAGLVNLTKSLARSLAPVVRVNCVAPGITLTPMGRETAEALAPDYAQKRLLLQRFATPEEIARWVVLVASPLSGFMTGATIDINGGRDLR
jgi:NAD(P)-dependent dehydrogenase (short-subunit alcohol dehydrogenase family)